MSVKDPDAEKAENLRTVYRELCTSYRAIDDFRAKLLGYLPLATGTGIFIIADNVKANGSLRSHISAMGAFGFIITLALFFYELYGIKKCTYVIRAGVELEKELDIKHGQFIKRPPGVAGFINEPFTAGVIYPAVLAAWTYLLVFGIPYRKDEATWWSIFVFFFGFALSVLNTLYLKLEAKTIQ